MAEVSLAAARAKLRQLLGPGYVAFLTLSAVKSLLVSVAVLLGAAGRDARSARRQTRGSGV